MAHHGWEWRYYMRDPDGYLIEIGQYMQIALDRLKEYDRSGAISPACRWL